MIISLFDSSNSLLIGMEATSESVKLQPCGGIISLRPLTLSDIDDLMVWVTDSEVARFCRFEPYQSKEEGINFINNVVRHHPWYRAICLDGRSVGAISVTENKSSRDQCRGELGYALGSKYWGQGIVTEAARMAVVEVFRERKELERVEALVDVDNIGSLRVLEKAGFSREGVLRKYRTLKGRTRDFVMFSFLSTDPIPQ